jgi:hypothetical protein
MHTICVRARTLYNVFNKEVTQLCKTRALKVKIKIYIFKKRERFYVEQKNEKRVHQKYVCYIKSKRWLRCMFVKILDILIFLKFLDFIIFL